MADTNNFLSWGDSFEVDPTHEFPTLVPGEYPFIIEKVERTSVQKEESDYYGCPMAAVTFRITGKDETGSEATITRTENFMLHMDFLWKISELFISVGLARKGERITPDWTGLPTRAGQCRVKVREYTNRNGDKRKSNDIEKFLDPATTEPAWKKGF